MDMIETNGQDLEQTKVLADQQKSLIDLLTKDFKRLQEQKARQTGGVEARTLEAISFSEGEQSVVYRNKGLFSEPQDPNKLYLVFNLIGRRVSKLMGRLCGIDPPFKARPDRKDPKAYAEAEVCDALISALDQKLDQPTRMWEIIYWLLHGGVAFEHVPWVPNSSMDSLPKQAEGDPTAIGLDGQPLPAEFIYTDKLTGKEIPQSIMDKLVQSGRAPESFELAEEISVTGDVGSEIFGPLQVFVDQNVKSLSDLAPDQRVYIARIRTQGWIEENFPGIQVEPDKNFQIMSTQFHQSGDSIGGTFLKDLIPLVQGSAGPDDPPMNVVIDSYAPPSSMNPSGRYTCFVPGKTILCDVPCPYGEIPLVDYHWKPVTTSFWNRNYVADLIAPQRFINKRVSQLGEQSNATLYSQLLLGGALKASDISPDKPGAIEGAVADNGIPLVQRLGPPEIPNWFMNSIESSLKLFNDIAGGADLMEETRFPGQIRGPMAVPMLQEILDTEWGPFFNHLGGQLARVKQMRLDRVKQFYPPVRTMHYTSRDMKDEVLTFHADKVLRSDINFNITVERGAIMPELSSLREGRIRERLSSPLMCLYMDERTGHLDKSKIAMDLRFGDVGRESREAQYRKLSLEIIEMLWDTKPNIPPVMPFYDHHVMMDELEASMATTEYLRASQPVQQGFINRWTQHQQFLAQQAQQQQQAIQSHMVHQAVAQATQQAAAQAAAGAVHEASAQIQAQHQQPTGQFVHDAQQQAQTGGPDSRPGAAPQRPPMPFQHPGMGQNKH